MQKLILLIVLLVIATVIYPQNPCPGIPTVTYESKTYNTVQIGTQCWLKENLDVGTMIQGSKTQSNNSIIEKYCYNNDPANCTGYGGLYWWDEAMQYNKSGDNVQGICPQGWRLPTYLDLYERLAPTISNDGNSLKAVGQGFGSGAGTNTTGFSVLLSGYIELNGTSQQLSTGFYIWTSNENNPDTWKANSFAVLSYTKSLQFLYSSKTYGYSVRCLKDNNTSIFKNPDEDEFPSEYFLYQNYPNPFNPSTTITYKLPKSNYVTLKVYDALGREVKVLVSEYQNAGVHNSSLHFSISSFPSGTYFYRIQTGNYSETKKMILLR
jgi:uncharacterized protein (TIGR02145 family)